MVFLSALFFISLYSLLTAFAEVVVTILIWMSFGVMWAAFNPYKKK